MISVPAEFVLASFGDDAEAEVAFLNWHVLIAVEVVGLDGIEVLQLAEHVDETGDLAALVFEAKGGGIEALL